MFILHIVWGNIINHKFENDSRVHTLTVYIDKVQKITLTRI